MIWTKEIRPFVKHGCYVSNEVTHGTVPELHFHSRRSLGNLDYVKTAQEKDKSVINQNSEYDSFHQGMFIYFDTKDGNNVQTSNLFRFHSTS